MTTTPWDYSALAAHYDRRADYAPGAIDRMIAVMGLAAGAVVADIGAGTGKLARPLAARGLTVRAVEPNDEMRAHGVRNTQGLPVTWRDGTAEATGLDDGAVQGVTFGSSFNVIDQAAGLRESRRIVGPRGWFCCLWNHRDLDDPLQARIEGVIRDRVPGYTYGTRREDPTAVLTGSGLFDDVQPFAASFTVAMTRESVLEAWRSHATLARQAGERFDDVVAAIGAVLTTDAVDVPYTTRGWCARFRT